MLTITAVIRAKKGSEDMLREALLEIADYVRAAEPDTIGYHVAQDAADPCVFTTYERFADQAAMDSHNESDAAALFFARAKPLLDGEVLIITGVEIAAK
jgi:quinol monooxygenase YgiN